MPAAAVIRIVRVFNFVTRCKRPQRRLSKSFFKDGNCISVCYMRLLSLNILGVQDTLYVKVKFVKIQGMTNWLKLWTILYWLWSAKVWVSNGIRNPSSPHPDRWGLGLKCSYLNLKLTRKSPTWQVMLQSRKSRELTVNFFSCGSYDLIWCNALHLTSSSKSRLTT